MASRNLRLIRRTTAALPAALLSTTAIAFAQSEPAVRYYHGPGMMWGDGYWGGFGMIFGLFFMLVVIAAIVAAVVLALRAAGLYATTPPAGSGNRGKALDILKERFARGEIDAEEFDQRKRLLAD